MLKRTATIAIASTLALVSAGLPLAAQVESTPGNNGVGTPSVRPDRSVGNDDVGLPDGVEDPVDGGLPDVENPATGTSAATGVIILEVDGVPNYYAPIDPSQVNLSGGNIPVYRFDRETTNSNGTSTDNDTNNEANATEDRGSGFVIYPPADSVEDLEPEDILQ